MRPTLIVAATVLTMFQFSCCKDKDKDEEPPVTYGPFYLGEAKDYLYFRPGSFWVYKNTTTNQLDTMVMQACDTVMVTNKGYYHPNRKMIYQSISFRTISLRDKSIYTSYTPEFKVDFTQNYNPILNRSAKTQTNIYQECNPFFYPFEKGIKRAYGIELMAKDSSITIQSVPYSPVQVFQIDMDITFPFTMENRNLIYYSKYYYAKNVGVIRYENKFSDKTEIWELINYQVAQ